MVAMEILSLNHSEKRSNKWKKDLTFGETTPVKPFQIVT